MLSFIEDLRLTQGVQYNLLVSKRHSYHLLESEAKIIAESFEVIATVSWQAKSLNPGPGLVSDGEECNLLQVKGNILSIFFVDPE